MARRLKMLVLIALCGTSLYGIIGMFLTPDWGIVSMLKIRDRQLASLRERLATCESQRSEERVTSHARIDTLSKQLKFARQFDNKRLIYFECKTTPHSRLPDSSISKYFADIDTVAWILRLRGNKGTIYEENISPYVKHTAVTGVLLRQIGTILDTAFVQVYGRTSDKDLLNLFTLAINTSRNIVVGRELPHNRVALHNRQLGPFSIGMKPWTRVMVNEDYRLAYNVYGRKERSSLTYSVLDAQGDTLFHERFMESQDLEGGVEVNCREVTLTPSHKALWVESDGWPSAPGPRTHRLYSLNSKGEYVPLTTRVWLYDPRLVQIQTEPGLAVEGRSWEGFFNVTLRFPVFVDGIAKDNESYVPQATYPVEVDEDRASKVRKALLPHKMTLLTKPNLKSRKIRVNLTERSTVRFLHAVPFRDRWWLGVEIDGKSGYVLQDQFGYLGLQAAE